jgi:hypothetical protein
VKKFSILLSVFVVCLVIGATWYTGAADALVGKFFVDEEPDLPSRFGVKKDSVDKEMYLSMRNEHLDMLRGFDTARPDSRERSIRDMEAAEQAVAERGGEGQVLGAAWRPLGPAPIPINASVSWSGRTSAIAIHPTNPDIAYVGTAQGGLYRTMNGGATWTPLLDNALSIAIGAVAIAPSDPTIVYVGTGESTLCGSGCYIGVGVYRINNADTDPSFTGPLNRDASNNDVFSGRAISEVLVHPTDANTIFVSTTSGIAGIGSSVQGLTLPARGVYRSTNALSPAATFTNLPLGISERSVTDIVMEPGNPNRIYAGVLGDAAAGGGGGVYSTGNALDPTPTFSQLLSTTLNGNQSRVELAANKVGDTTTVIAASGEGTGQVFRSVNHAPFTLLVDNNFCNPQCFYDIAVAMDPGDANRVYLGGSPTLVFGRSTNGGTSFANSSSGVHVDTQAIAISPSNPDIAYLGTDGGIWRTANVRNAGAVTWAHRNTSTYYATQFMGLAIHPIDRNYSLGGTQDNGTEFLEPNGTTWINSDGGDGGFAVIDRAATSTTTLTTYHTYFNQTNTQIGYSKATTTVGNGDPNWGTFLGCGGTANGISCSDATLFYAPMVGGPTAADSPTTGTLYFGTNKLYRSANAGVTMVPVSQTLTGIQPNGAAERVSAIGIAPSNDSVRLIGSTIGKVYLSTTAGATTMTDVSGPIPDRYVGRIVIDPNNANIAYVGLNGFGVQHIWKTTNLLSGTPAWAAASTGLPDTPVSSMVIDPSNTQMIYAGTDIGVFRSTNGGDSWTPFSTGLPRVAVFGMEIQNRHRVLRIATHGKGMYEMSLQADGDFHGDAKADLAVYRPSNGTWYVARQSGIPSQSFDATQFGVSSDAIVPGDYDGDGKGDIAVYRPSTGIWYLSRSTAGFTAFNFGQAGDIPVQADYDADGKTDVAVFRPSNGIWYMLQSTAGFNAVSFGTNGDKPVQGDYDGDGKADQAVFRPSDGRWYLLRSTAGFTATAFGLASDKLVPADYNADGRTDIAVFRESDGTWYRLISPTGAFSTVQFGSPGDIPVPADYDGDGRADISVFRPSNGTWYRIDSVNNITSSFQFGSAGDIPVSARFIPQQ